MPDFTFTSPEGKSYTVAGPDGATQEQAFAILQQHLGAGEAAAAPAPPGADGYLDAIKTGVASTYDKAMAAAAHAATTVNDALSPIVPDSWAENDRRLRQEHTDAALAEEQKLAATPGGAGIAGNAAAGLAYAPAGVLAPLVAGGAEGNARYEELIRAGVDPRTAAEDAVVHGAVNAGAQMVPMGSVAVREGAKVAARTALSAGARAAAVGAGQELVDDTATQQLLEAQGYDQQAEQYAPSLQKAAEGAAFMAPLHVATSAMHGAIVGHAPETAPPPAEAPPGYVPPREGAPVADQLAAVRAARVAPVADAEAMIAAGRAAADDQRSTAAVKLDEAKTADQMIAAAGDLASRPNDDVEARVGQMAVRAGAAARAQQEDATHIAATDKLNEALDAEVKLAPTEIPLFHGTKNPDVTIDTLSKTDDLGPHFTTDPETARLFAEDAGTPGRVLEARGSFARPLDLPDLNGWFPTVVARAIDEAHGNHVGAEEQSPLEARTWAEMQAAKDAHLNALPEELQAQRGHFGEGSPELKQAVNEALEVGRQAGYKVLRDELATRGYDSIRYRNDNEGAPADTYITLDKSRVRARQPEESLAEAQAQRVLNPGHAEAVENLRSSMGYVPDLVRERMQAIERRTADEHGGPSAVVRDPVGYAHALTENVNAEARAIRDRPQPGVANAVGREVVDRIGVPANEPLTAPMAAKGETVLGSGERKVFSQDPAHLSSTPDTAYKFARTVGEAVNHAARTGNDFAKALAARILPLVKDAPFRVVEPGVSVPGGVPAALSGARGVQWTRPSKGMDGVWVKGRGFGDDEQGVNNQTVLHEGLHQATVMQYVRGKNGPKGSVQATHAAELDRLQQHVVQQYKLLNAQGKIPAGLQAVAHHAFNDPKELITWGFTDARVQAFLRNIPGIINRTSWGDFVDTVRSMFGMAKEHTSALADLVDVTHRLMGAELTPEMRAWEAEMTGKGLLQRTESGDNGAHDDTNRTAGEPVGARAGADAGGGLGEGSSVHEPAGAGQPAAGAANALSAPQRMAVAGPGREPGERPLDREEGAGTAERPRAAEASGDHAAAALNAPAPRAAAHATRIGARALDALSGFGDKTGLGDALHEVQEALMPMSAPGASDRAMAWAKDYANGDRLAQWQWQKFTEILTKNYSPERLEAMWNAADEENLIRGGHEPASPDRGLASLSPDERATVDTLHAYGEELIQRAASLGMFDGEALPYWSPRMAVMLGEDGTYYRPPRSGTVGVDITTSAPSLKQRKYLRAEDTEAAQKGRLGDNAQMVRDIRTMPLAMARMERAIAGRELVERVRAASSDAGDLTVSETPADGFFTLDHPAFKVYSPQFTTDSTGKVHAAVDQFGQPIFQQRQLYIRNEFRGPLQSIVYDAPGKAYSALMALKRASTGMIMYSPLIHNQVIFGKALPAAGFNPAKLVGFYIKGHALRSGSDFSTMREAIRNGMAPIGNFGAKQDITDIAGGAQLAPGHGPISRVVGAGMGLVHKGAADVAMRGIDAAGHLWHNTLLWDRIADLQVGLYAHSKAKLVKQFSKMGMDAAAADRAAGLEAAHLANRYAGALPNESMSGIARKVANLTLFSRSFTLGNMGLFKDAAKGLPAEVRAQLTMEFGRAVADKTNGVARRKAMAMLMMETGGMFVLGSLVQDGVRAWLSSDDDHSIAERLGERMAAYGPRAKAAVAHAIADPGDVLPFVGHPFRFIHSFFSNGTNEPGLENRIRGANMNNGTATYYRMPFGKVGEDMEGWMSQPLQMAWQKAGTLVKPVIDIGMQAAGHPPDGRNIWAPSDSTLTAFGKAAAHLMAAQLPLQDAQVAADLAKGSTNATTQTAQQQERESMQKRKLLLPIATGVTVRQGFPGGPVAGAAFHASQEAEAQRAYLMPQIHQLVQTGDPDDRREAIEKMRSLGMTPPQMLSYLKYQQAPAARLSAHRMQTLQRTDPAGADRVRAAMADE